MRVRTDSGFAFGLIILTVFSAIGSPGRLWSQDVVISEILALNESQPTDDDGDRSDWIEIHNRSARAVDLNGWSLVNGTSESTPWRIPSFNLPPGQRTVIFASGKNRTETGRPFHTDFQLSSDGEYLALRRPDGSAASEFSPAYPPQAADISFGLLESSGNEILIMDHGAPATALIPESSDASLDWTDPDFNDNGWLRGSTGVGYDYFGRIGLDTGAMRNQNESVFIRVQFTVDRIPDISRLILRLEYEDGMVAYLNGTEVARDNAPENLTWNSGAPQNRPDNIAVEPADFDITEFIGLLREGRNILAIHGLNNLVGSSDLLIRPQLVGVEEGENGGYGYSFRPSPHEANGEVVSRLGPPVLFSRTGQTFETSVSVEISSADPSVQNTEIRYTTDGSVPNRSSRLYNGPVTINTSTTLSARVFGPNGMAGPVQNGIFLRINPDTRTFSSDLPLLAIDTQGNGNIPSSGWLPVTLSVFEGPDGGRTTLQTPPSVQSRAGIRVRGSSTAGRPKPSLNLELWDSYGSDENRSLLGMPAESDWILWGPYNFDPTYLRNPLVYELSNRIGRYAVRTRFVEVFLNRDGDNLEESDYFGVYVLMEKISRDDDRVDVEKILPEHQEEPWITGGYMFKIDRPDPGDSGFFVPRQNVLYLEPKEDEMEQPLLAPHREWVQDFMADVANSTTDRSSPVRRYEQFWDVGAAIDHHLINVMAFNVDALRLSTYMHLPRGGKLTFGPIWDFDRSQGSTDGRDSNPGVWRSTGGDRGTDFFNYPWWDNLFSDLEFFQRYIDRWQELNAPGQPLHLQSIHALIDNMAGQVREASARNEARWGVFRSTFNSEINRLKNWYSQRIDFINSQFVRKPFVNVSAVQGGAGYEVIMISPDGGQIYYTLDGSDPRREGGNPAQGATRYTGAFTVSSTSLITARVRNQSHNSLTGANNPPLSSEWSGPATARVSVNRAPAPGDIRITEINYHPAPPSGRELDAMPLILDNDFEFLELTNVSDDTLDLGQLRLDDGVEFNFVNGGIQSIGPGESVVVVSNTEAFVLRYGEGMRATVAGEYTQSLSNAGELIRLVNSAEEIIFEVDYRDGWQPLTDGTGFTLVLGDLDGSAVSASQSENWGRSAAFHGSPGSPQGPAEITPTVVISEFLTHSDPPLADYIEILNTGSEPVDISGWYLSDDRRSPFKYRFPAGTLLDSDSPFVVEEAQFSDPALGESAFSLSATGEEIYLLASGEAETLSGAVHGFTFGGSQEGVSFGRIINSVGEEKLSPLESRTPGQPNSPALVGPIVISEIHYHPSATDAQTNNLEDEFVELTVTAGQPVPLFDVDNPASVWRLRGGVDYDFPTGITLEAGESVVLTSLDPATSTAGIDAFRERFGVPPQTRIFGPFSGNLNNAGEQLRLEAPEAPQPPESPDAGLVPYYVVDQVVYAAASPWPVSADGNGDSLHRAPLSSFADDPSSWLAALPSPGAVPDPGNSGQPAITGVEVDNDSLIISFEAAAGVNYQLLQTASLPDGPWTVVETMTDVSTDGTRGFTVPLEDDGEISARFFTIRTTNDQARVLNNREIREIRETFLK